MFDRVLDMPYGNNHHHFQCKDFGFIAEHYEYVFCVGTFTR